MAVAATILFTSSDVALASVYTAVVMTSLTSMLKQKTPSPGEAGLVLAVRRKVLKRMRRVLAMALSVVVLVDVTAHGLILIRAGIRIPGASI